MLEKRFFLLAEAFFICLILPFVIFTVHDRVDSGLERDRSGKRYGNHDTVRVVVNKIGSYNNPTETYPFYSLPFCTEHSTPEEESVAASENDIELSEFSGPVQVGGLRYKQKFGEWIVGDRLQTSPYQIGYIDSTEWRLLCHKHLQPEDVAKLKEAIHDIQFYEMFVEDLPMWGYIGDVVDGRTYIFTHYNFILGINNDQIVSAMLTSTYDRRVDITDVKMDRHVEFSYSVEWIEDPRLTWKTRMSRYRYCDECLFPKSFNDIHWHSLFSNVAFIAFFIVWISCKLKKLDNKATEQEESGWKLLHGDVFRFPSNPALFCAAVGAGNQLIVATFCHLVLAVTGLVSPLRRGSLLNSAILMYSITSFVSGYSSIRLYRQMNGKKWLRCIAITAGLFPAPTLAVFLWVNSVARLQMASQELPLAAISTIVALYSFVSFPTMVLGGIFAKSCGPDYFNAPTRTADVAREIPEKKAWLSKRPLMFLIGGNIPFVAIYTDLHFIFSSLWGHQLMSYFAILLLSFIALIALVSLNTAMLVYKQLSFENHRWWWMSFANGGMVGIFIFAWSFYFYFNRSGMTGLMQTSVYFGYMAVVSLGVFLMLGAAGFQFSLIFVKHIYSRIADSLLDRVLNGEEYDVLIK